MFLTMLTPRSQSRKFLRDVGRGVNFGQVCVIGMLVQNNGREGSCPASPLLLDIVAKRMGDGSRREDIPVALTPLVSMK